MKNSKIPHAMQPFIFCFDGGDGGGRVQIVFIPVWIVMCVALVGVIYAVILAIILLRSSDIVPEQRRGSACSAIGYTCFIIPLLVFEVCHSLMATVL